MSHSSSGDIPAPLPSPAAPPEIATAPAPPTKSRKSERWAKTAAALFSIVTLIRGCDALVQMFGSDAPGLQACDAASVTDTLRSLLKKHAGTEVAAFTDIQTTTRSDTAASCHATMRLQDEATGIIDYSLDLENDSTMVRIPSAKGK